MSRLRRNIDSLTASELADYEYAVRKVIEISEQNPESKDGYGYFAALHDDIDVGPCEHGRDTFLPWHRAHLWEFEEALRRSDAPRTKDVTIPYWNWSERATGLRYPRPFENEASILFKPGRNTMAVTGAPYPWGFVNDVVLSAQTWSTGVHFGGAAAGESDCSSHGRSEFGTLEWYIHNPMHGSFIGGLMGNPATAAEDPIFYSFHAFIDVVWWQWQQMPGRVVDSCLQCKLCGLYRHDAPAKRWTVGDTVNAATAPLGYAYEFTPAGVPQPVDTHPAVPLLLEANRPVVQLKSVDLVVPNIAPESALLSLQGIANRNEVTFDVLIFLSPKGEPIEPGSPEFMNKRLKSHVSVWQVHHSSGNSHGHGHGPADSMRGVLDLTKAVSDLSEVAPGETWTLTAVTAARLSEPQHEHTHMKVHDFHADIGVTEQVPRQVGFATMELNIGGSVVNG